MSYCVNCGVELAPSEKVCPLCDTPVINPNEKVKSDEYRPYPKQVEKVMQKVDRRFGVLLGTLILAIPLTVTLLADMIISHRFSWSLYVAGALMCIFVFVLLPFLFEKKRPFLCLSTDAVALLIYLAVISYETARMSWFLPLALPLVAIVYVCVSLMVAAGNSKRLHGLYKPAMDVGIGALGTVLIEMVFDNFLHGGFVISWSLIVLIVGIIIFFILITIEKKQKLKDEIRRRLFL